MEHLWTAPGTDLAAFPPEQTCSRIALGVGFLISSAFGLAHHAIQNTLNGHGMAAKLALVEMLARALPCPFVIGYQVAVVFSSETGLEVRNTETFPFHRISLSLLHFSDEA